MNVLISLVTGGAVGAAFAVLGLPVPAPISVVGVLGILGVTVGYRLVISL